MVANVKEWWPLWQTQWWDSAASVWRNMIFFVIYAIIRTLFTVSYYIVVPVVFVLDLIASIIDCYATRWFWWLEDTLLSWKKWMGHGGSISDRR